MGDKVGENPAALRATVFLLSAKNRRGVFKHPPAGRRLTPEQQNSSRKITKLEGDFGALNDFESFANCSNSVL